MFEIKRSLKKIMGSNDPFQTIFYGNPSQDNFREAGQQFQRMDESKRQALIARCFKKLFKQKKACQIINILYLINKVSKISSKIGLNSIALNFNSLSQPKIRSGQKGNKKETAETHFAKFFYKFSKSLLCRDHSLNLSSSQCPINKSIQVAQLSLQALLSLLQVQFILNYFIVNQGSGEYEIMLQIQKRIMDEAISQFQYLIKFVNKWKYLIIQNSQHSIAINEIYQKTIKVNKDRKKLQSLAKKLKMSYIKIPQFQFDSKLNNSIQKAMLNKQSQRRAYKTQKQIKSKKIIQQINEGDQIDQNDILIDQGQFI